jgi:hypothetical protein
VSRAAELRALQGTLCADDLPRVRALFDEEVGAHARGEGELDTLRLAGYLLAVLGEPDDVWRHWQAKLASGGTFAAYPTAALAGAGLELTLAWVHASSHPAKAEVLALLALVTSDDVAAWWAWMREEFPAVTPPAGRP